MNRLTEIKSRIAQYISHHAGEDRIAIHGADVRWLIERVEHYESKMKSIANMVPKESFLSDTLQYPYVSIALIALEEPEIENEN